MLVLCLGSSGHTRQGWADMISPAVASPHDLDSEHSNNLHFPDAKLVSDRSKLDLRKWKVKEAVQCNYTGQVKVLN